MAFRYLLKMSVDKETARKVIMDAKIAKRASMTKSEVSYEEGYLVVKPQEDHDIDDELIKLILQAIGKPVEARAFLITNGKEKEVFRGYLDPKKPLGMSTSSEQKSKVEEETVEEEEEVEEELFDLFDEEEFFEEEEDLFTDEEEEY